MAALPRDMPDVYFAPVVLAADARLDELDRLSFDALITIVEGADNHPVLYQSFREAALIDAIQQSIDCHGWAFSWDPRGLRLTHREHTVVLGVPPSLTSYLSGVRTTKAFAQ